MDACRLRRHQSSKSGHPLYIAGRATKNNYNINPEVLREFLKYSSIPDTILHKITKRKGRYLNATISDTDTHTVRDQLL